MPREKTGTVFRRKADGPWYARITLIDGTRTNAFALDGSQTWTEARAREAAAAYTERAHREKRVRLPSATKAQPSTAPTTIDTMLARWLDVVVSPGALAPATKAGHRTNASRIRAAFGTKTPADLTIPTLRAWLRVLRTELSASRTRNVFNTLGKFIDDAAAEGWHAAPNHCRSGAVHAELPAVGERGDEERARHTEGEASRLLVSVRDVAPVRFVRYVLAFTSGMREGELAGLRWSSVAAEHGVAVLRVTSALALVGDVGKGSRRAPKTKASKRPVPMHPLGEAVLAWWKATGWRAYVGREPRDEDPILPAPDGAPCRPDSAPLLRADLEAAGLPSAYEGEPFEMRSTRRSFTTWLDAHGVPGEVQDRLIRHADASVRGRHYRGETPEGLARLAAAVATIRLEVELPTGGRGGDETSTHSSKPGSEVTHDTTKTDAISSLGGVAEWSKAAVLKNENGGSPKLESATLPQESESQALAAGEAKSAESGRWTKREDESIDALETSVASLARSLEGAIAAGALDLAAVLARQVDRLTGELRERRLAAAGVPSLPSRRGMR